ncbi:MAG: nuclear transport factor 2 family protein [Dehalococcoidia bacterium]|nr:nuclear transport factor 2 family protein [Dehalococcoidia bacterium]
MSILETYVESLKAGDASRIAALFAEDAVFHDEAPAKMGFDPIIVRGHRDIEEFYRKTFKHGGMKVSNVGINGNAMRYDVVVGKLSLLCLGVVTEEKGLIKQYRVTAV